MSSRRKTVHRTSNIPYINPGGEVAANYVEKTVTVDLPCYSTTRFVKDDKGNDCVPDINNYYFLGLHCCFSG